MQGHMILVDLMVCECAQAEARPSVSIAVRPSGPLFLTSHAISSDTSLVLMETRVLLLAKQVMRVFSGPIACVSGETRTMMAGVG